MENVKSTVFRHNHRILSKTTNAIQTLLTQQPEPYLKRNATAEKPMNAHSESIAWKAALFIKLKSQREITEKLNITSG
jgi:prephenate dehydrogenase